MYKMRKGIIASAIRPSELIFSVDTTSTSAGSSASNQFAFPFHIDGDYNALIDYGDGSGKKLVTAYNDSNATHTYAVGGEYTIKVSGLIKGWKFGDGGDKLKMRVLSSFGPLTLVSNDTAFYGCSNMTITATDIFKLENTIDFILSETFRNCASVTSIPGLAKLDTTNVDTMAYFWAGCSTFDQDISVLNWSNVTSITALLSGCTAFNNGSSNNFKDIDWSSVTTANLLLQNCSNFNQPWTNIDTSGWTTFDRVWINCTAFNQPLAHLDMSSATTCYRMLESCVNWNQSVDGWDWSSMTRVARCFYNCNSFNQDITVLDWSNVTDSLGYNDILTSADNFNNGGNSMASLVLTSSNVPADNMFRNTSLDKDLGSVNIGALTSMNGFLEGVTMSTANTDATYIGWDAQAVQSGVVLNMGGSTYTAAGAGGTARASLISNDSWTITDGGGV